MAKTKLVIDTDGVTDDVRAISLALQYPDVEVVAITTVSGCVTVDQTVANVARTLRANNKSKIPIYKGAANPLIGNENNLDNEVIFFGKDGLGDFHDEFPKVLDSDRIAHVPNVHAAVALTKIFKENKDLKLVCIGPLTNIALALKLDPEFAGYPKEVIIMGGNVHGKGNVRSNSTAEFNFSSDPEAAHILIKEMKCPITVVPWEAFLHESKETKVDFHAHLKLDVPLANFFEMATRRGREELERNHRQFSYCDEVAVSIACAPEKIILQDQLIRGAVELHGSYTRGQMALDWTEGLWSEDNDHPKINRGRKEIRFVVHYNVKALDEMIFDTIRRSQSVQNGA